MQITLTDTGIEYDIQYYTWKRVTFTLPSNYRHVRLVIQIYFMTTA